jgi:hypothetical protein
MDVILNIGLANNPRDVRGSLEVLNFYGLVPAEHQLLDSDTEPTLVVTVHTGELPVDVAPSQAIFCASKALGQDCIAAYIPARDVGRLIGPRADKWGAFNPEFFLMPGGSRLSDSQPAARAA